MSPVSKIVNDHCDIHPIAERKVKTNSDSGWVLYRGIRNLMRCDEAEVVSGIVRYVISKHRALHFMAPLIERTRGTLIPPFFAVLGWLRVFLCVRPASTGRTIWIARLSNERRAIESFLDRAPDLDWTELKYSNWPDAAGLIALIRLRRKRVGLRHILSIARRLHRHHEFFKVLRVIELIGYYTRYLQVFAEHDFRLAVTSSHSNPHAIAFNLAARKNGVPIVLVTHGMPVRPVARLSFDLALVHCKAARQTYLSEGCSINEVLIQGRKQHHVSMPTALPDSLSVGIFLCKDVNEDTFLRLVNLLRGQERVSRIVVRPHPKNLWTEFDTFIASLKDPRLVKAVHDSVWNNLRDVDVVFGGNSSVLIDVVVAGRPAVYVPDLDYGSDDLHQLVSRGLVYRFVEPLLSGHRLIQFYQTPTWSETLRLFADIDVDDEIIALRFCDSMRKLISYKNGRAVDGSDWMTIQAGSSFSDETSSLICPACFRD